MPPYVPVRMKAFEETHSCVARDEKAFNRHQAFTTVSIDFPEGADLKIERLPSAGAHRDFNDEVCHGFSVNRARQSTIVLIYAPSFRGKVSKPLQNLVG